MSDYEKHIGTIEKVNFDGTIEEFSESLNLGELPDYYDNWEEYFRNESEEYHIHNDSIYRIQNEEIDNSDDICEYKIQNNKIDYVLSFYNGGTCLSEQIDYILDKLHSKLDDEQGDKLIWKDNIEQIGYTDDFWYALTNDYIDLDKLLIDNKYKTKLNDAIKTVLDFQYELESSDFYEEL